MTKKYLILLFVLLSRQTFFAQQPFYKNIGINEGLPSTEIYSSLQDKKGYLWFSSDAGVCRYNGSSFDYFTTENGLPDNSVFRLMEDRKGRIWMSCYNGCVCYYENGKIRSIAACAELKNELKSGSFLILSIQMDDADTLWLGTTKELYKIPPTSDYKNILIDNSFNNKSFFVIRILNNGRSILSQYHNDRTGSNSKEHDLEKYNYNFEVKSPNAKQNFSYTVHSLVFLPVCRSLLTKKGDLLFTYDNILYRLDPKGNFTQRSFPQTIIALDDDALGNVNVGVSRGGSYSFANADLTVKPAIFFPTFSVSSATKDFEGGMWFTTLEKGLFYAPFNNYFRFYDTPDLCGKITGIGVVDQKFFIANYKNQLFTIDLQDSVEQLHSAATNNGSLNYHFYSFNNKIYACGNRISEIDLQKKNTKDLTTKENAIPSGLGMAQLSANKLVCVTYGIFFEIENNVLIKKFVLKQRATCLLKTGKGELLMGTQSGLYSIKDTLVIPVDEPRLQNERITSIVEKDDILFVTTKSKGLFIRENEKWSLLNSSSGLPTDLCNSVFPDEDGNVWVATNKGLSFFEMNDRKKITTLNISDGLPTNEVSSIARLGKSLFVGTRDGLCEIKLDRQFRNPVRPFIYFNSISVNDSNYLNSTATNFSYYQNDLIFRLDRITYKGPSPQFAYHLIGYEDSLKYSSAPTVEYSNLRPGNYIFEAYAMNNDGIRSLTPSHFSFSIQKPWWLKWWFIAFEFIFLFLMVYLALRWRIKMVKEQEAEKRNIEKTIAEYQMTALQAQMNPHFIFNAINSIQNFILKNETQPAYDYLAKFSKLIRLVLNNSRQNTISLDKEIETLKLYIELEQLRFKKSFDFELTIDPSIKDLSEIEIPTMLIQPYIENAIWHGIMPMEGKRKGVIKTNIILENDHLKIIIEDNGVGRKFSNNISKIEGKGSFGMSLVAQKIDILKRTDQKKASTKVIDLLDPDGEATGTHIEILVPINHYT